MKKSTKIIPFTSKIIGKEVVGNLALKKESLDSSNYSSPKVKKLAQPKQRKQIVMGCWTSSYSANDGDGC